MEPIEVAEIEPGAYRLYLVAGTTDVDQLIVELGHEPNGPFWEEIVELLVAFEAPALDDRFWSDSEADAYLAHSDDRTVLDDLAARLHAIGSDGTRLRRLLETAADRGIRIRG